jgi:hypothetical protein
MFYTFDLIVVSDSPSPAGEGIGLSSVFSMMRREPDDPKRVAVRRERRRVSRSAGGSAQRAARLRPSADEPRVGLSSVGRCSRKQVQSERGWFEYFVRRRL